jgi:hypothetical protein
VDYEELIGSELFHPLEDQGIAEVKGNICKLVALFKGQKRYCFHESRKFSFVMH